MFIAGTALFLLLRIIPGDPAQIIVGMDRAVDEAQLADIRGRLGLNEPLIKQYGNWLFAAIRLDFGTSWQKALPVGQLLVERLRITLLLALVSMGIAVLIALPAGVVSAVRQDDRIDHVIMGTSHIVLAIPGFWLGIMLLLMFSVVIPIFPLYGSLSLRHFILPAITLGFGSAAFLSRLVRTAILRELDRDYVFFFTQLGLPRSRVIWRHVLPNALIPIAIPAGIQFGYLLGGAIIIEQIFSMGGTGRLILHAIQTRDFPLIQGTVIFLAAIFSLVNFAADIFVTLADPEKRI